MPLAHAITFLRMLAAPLTVWAVISRHTSLAALLFGLAVITDLTDGMVARRRGEVSVFGGLLDHTTDAFYVASTLAVLAFHREVPFVLPVLVVAAFAQYVLDSRAHAGLRLRASSLGRWNGIAYFVLAGTPIVRDAFAWTLPPATWVRGAGWVLVVTTLLSMLDRWTSRRKAPGSPAAGTGDR